MYPLCESWKSMIVQPAQDPFLRDRALKWIPHLKTKSFKRESFCRDIVLHTTYAPKASLHKGFPTNAACFTEADFRRLCGLWGDVTPKRHSLAKWEPFQRQSLTKKVLCSWKSSWYLCNAWSICRLV